MEPLRLPKQLPDPIDDAPPAADLLEQYLAQRDIACPVCGYGLRGLVMQHCPECAASLSLTVAATKNGAVRFAAAPTRFEAAARTTLRVTKHAVATSRDAFAEHHTRSATLDAFAQIGLVVGIVLHAAAGIWCILAPRPATIALGALMLLVVAACAGLLRISAEAGAWAASQRASIRCAYAFAGWWWTAVWLVLALISLF